VKSCPDSKDLQLGEVVHASVFLLDISCGSSWKPHKSCYFQQDFQDFLAFSELQQELLFSPVTEHVYSTKNLRATGSSSV